MFTSILFEHLFPTIYVAIGVAAFLLALLAYARPVMAGVFVLIALSHLELVVLLAMLRLLPLTPDDLLANIRTLLDPLRAAEAAATGAACFTGLLIVFLRGGEHERRAHARNGRDPPTAS